MIILNFENEYFAIVFGILALSFLFVNYETSIKIIDYLKLHDEKYNPNFLRINIFKITKKYKYYKLKEEKRIGKEYYVFFGTFFMFVMFAFLSVISIFIS